MENPYQSPQSVDEVPAAVPSGESLARLRLVAERQRRMLVSVVGYFAGCIALILAAGISGIEASILGTVFIGTTLFMAVSVAGLIVELDNSIVAVVYFFLVLIPLLGLLALLSASRKATEKLKRAGFHVSLLGADMTQFAAREGNDS